jgi:Ca-activated chloride channel family protein
MQAMDFEEDGRPADRLSAVKRVFRDFVAGTGDLPGRPDDLIGLVAFGGYPDSRCPLTLDHGALLEILGSLEIPRPMEDSRGRVINMSLLEEELATAIGDALALGVARLKDAEAASRVLILLSDGESNFGEIDPLDAAKAASDYGIKVYTIGIGSTGLAPFPVRDPFGKVYLEDRPVVLDEDLLESIAEKTGGQYFNARNTESLVNVYQEIDSLEKTKTEGRLYTEYRELFQFFLFSGIALVVLEVFLSLTRFRSLP